MTKNAPMPQPGEKLHFLVSGVTFHAVVHHQHTGIVSQRGQELTITAELLEANADRNGVLAPFLALVHDPDAQVKRWGQQLVAAGPWPRDLLLTIPGEAEHEEARRQAVRDAEAIDDPSSRRDALRAVEELFGPAQPTSRTNALYAGSDL